MGQMRLHITALDGGRIKVVKIIYDRHSPTIFREQSVDEMRADEAGAAGYENIFFVRQD